MSIPIDPRFMTARAWTAQTSIVLAPYGVIPVLLDDDEWMTWARYVVGLPALSARDVPRPEGFGDWHEWARAFNGTVKLLAT